ncbi:hypothetical protein TOPH_01934 [Tolypocladium ophioglossoides CBS 100239]|uniref:Uncharacterized protein n=1 Tax=Tolypocladium ophioglossoides (strain CBS 100239) TaxID=1163406 RepID=A0A0L0NI11_TOLOC|nr:hypothetical protein TOPH_01934 [Tolypocladium ophioglossoides CBS 100239]
MDGTYYCEDEANLQRLVERRKYIELDRQAETARGFDSSLSATLEDEDVQHFAHAIWLYEDGRIGFYYDVLGAFEESRNF